jgi:hypothetical protein
VATSSTNSPGLAFNFGFNGTTWDRLRDDANKYLYVDIGATPAGGLQVNLAPSAARVRGQASATGISATSIIAAQGAGTYLHIKSCQAFRTDGGATAIYVTLNDSVSTVIGIPGSAGGGGNNAQFDVPLVLAANTALTFTASAATSTVFVACQGWSDSLSN